MKANKKTSSAKKDSPSSDSAVSAVIGVMLLLVLTVILAAAAAAVITGIFSMDSDNINADFKFLKVEYDEDEDEFFIFYEMQSGTPFNPSEVHVALTLPEGLSAQAEYFPVIYSPTVYSLTYNETVYDEVNKTYYNQTIPLISPGERLKIAIPDMVWDYLEKEDHVETLDWKFVQTKNNHIVSRGAISMREFRHEHDGILFIKLNRTRDIDNDGYFIQKYDIYGNKAPMNYYILKDYYLSDDNLTLHICNSTFKIRNGTDVNFCLNNHALVNGVNYLGSIDDTVGILTPSPASFDSIKSMIQVVGGNLQIFDCRKNGRITSASGGTKYVTPVHVLNGTFTLRGGKIGAKNSGFSTNYGAVLVTGEDSVCTIAGGSVQYNTGAFTGGVGNFGGTLYQTGGNISHNTGRLSGGVGNFGGEYSFTNGNVSYNTGRYGGGILVRGADSHLTIEDSKKVLVSSNAASNSGGGICVNESKADITGGYIEDNKIKEIEDNKIKEESGKSVYGGAGIASENSVVTIKSCHIERNCIDATTNRLKYGIGICQKEGTLNIDNSVINSNCISGYNASVIGGGIYSKPVTLNINGGEICNNRAKEGGGIAIDGNEKKEGNSVILLSDVTINDVEISNNTAYDDGGGIFIYRANVVITNSEISLNKADGGGSFTTWHDSNDGVRDGGGIYCSLGTNLTMEHNYITNNTAGYGGGIAMYAFPLSRADIDKKSYFYGILPVLYIVGSDPIMMDSSFNDNYLDYTTNVVFKNGFITGNNATEAGGGIFNEFVDFYLDGGVIAENTAGPDGNLNRGQGIFTVKTERLDILDISSRVKLGEYQHGGFDYNKAVVMIGNNQPRNFEVGSASNALNINREYHF